MSLRVLDETQILKTCGLVNTGDICYLNGFLQAMLTCTSVNQFFLEHEAQFTLDENKVAIAYIDLLKSVQNAKSYSDVINPSNVFREIVIATKKKFPDKKFGQGQEDSGEGIHLFLDAIDSKELYKFFMYKYVVTIWCLTCVKEISKTKDESCILEVPPTFSGILPPNTRGKQQNPLNAHIRQYISALDDYTCKDCKLQKCCRIYQLACAPEIITVMFNKFYHKSMIEFPQFLSFPTLDNTNIEYKMIAKIEHSGGQNGGHYWAHCLRKGNPELKDNESDGLNMYKLNDVNISTGTFEPSKESYMMFYHCI